MMEMQKFVLIDGFDDAILGRCVSTGRYIYSMQKILNTMIFRDNMSHEDADEYFWYNIERSLAYFGDMSPIILDDISYFNPHDN